MYELHYCITISCSTLETWLQLGAGRAPLPRCSSVRCCAARDNGGAAGQYSGFPHWAAMSNTVTGSHPQHSHQSWSETPSHRVVNTEHLNTYSCFLWWSLSRETPGCGRLIFGWSIMVARLKITEVLELDWGASILILVLITALVTVCWLLTTLVTGSL